MKNDWALSDKSLVKLIPDLSKLSATVAGAEIALDLKQRLREDPTALQTITTAYLKLSIKAKERRKPGDPWPVIIIDEANALSEWEDKRSLFALLKFFVYLTKEMQLAHGEFARLAKPSHLRGTSCLFSQSSSPPATRFCCSGWRRARQLGMAFLDFSLVSCCRADQVALQQHVHHGQPVA
jgi:hypothetical protein